MENINDQSAMYGGYRTPQDGTLEKPYLTIQEGIDAAVLAGAPFTNVTALDDLTYDENVDIDGVDLVVQAALGKSPVIIRGIGVRVTREVTAQYNNSTAIYFNKQGDNANDGTWQLPKETCQDAIDNAAGKAIIFGGINNASPDLY